jgi:hypothetical protein
MRTPWTLALAACLSLAAPLARAQAETTEIDPDLAAAAAADERLRSERPEAAGNWLAPLVANTPLAQLNPDMSLILDVSLGWFSRDDRVRQGGHAPDENGFTLQGLEWTASASVDPYFRFDLNFQIAHLHLEEAYLTTLALPWGLQARAGTMNASFGRENPRHLHTWHFVNPSLAHTRFMSEEHFSGLGAELSWLTPLPWYVLVVLQALDTHGSTAFRSSSFGRVELNQSGKLDGPEDFLYLARLETFVPFGDDWSLYLGGSAAFGQSPYAPDDRVDLWGADLYLKWRPLGSGPDSLAVALTLEYFLRDTQVPGDSVRDHGGYLQLDAQVDKRWVVNLRAENLGGLRGVSPEPDRLGSWAWRASAAVTFLPTHFSKLRLQYDAGHAQGRPGAAHALVFQIEVSAGEHGAHAF